MAYLSIITLKEKKHDLYPNRSNKLKPNSPYLHFNNRLGALFLSSKHLLVYSTFLCSMHPLVLTLVIAWQKSHEPGQVGLYNFSQLLCYISWIIIDICKTVNAFLETIHTNSTKQWITAKDSHSHKKCLEASEVNNHVIKYVSATKMQVLLSCFINKMDKIFM